LTVLRDSGRYLAWGRAHRFRHRVTRPAFAVDLPELLAAALAEEPHFIAHGMGRSYGDSCLNGGHGLIDMRGLDHLIAFDRESGVLETEAGASLADILGLLGATAAPGRTWFLPVTPGTKFVTVGGAIANDVHGKNHHRAGCFGGHVLSLRLLRSNGAIVDCSPAENADLFAATIGGLGLTGLILSARIKLAPVPSLWLETESIRYGELDSFFKLADSSETDWEYTVAWIDCHARGRALGRGIFTRARHSLAPSRSRNGPSAAAEHRLALPMDLPRFVLNDRTIAVFNALYWRTAPIRPAPRVFPFDRVLYPLDGIGSWNRMYGRRGFYQYQCVVPARTAGDAVPALIEKVARYGEGSFLSVLKTFGDKTSPGMLSFPMPGATLALDFPNRGGQTLALMDSLDEIVGAVGGRIYPAKDGRVSAERFQAGYPNWRRFAAHVDPHFSSGFWRRVSTPAGADRAP